MSKSVYETECEVVHETDEAFLLRIYDDEHWIPKACLANADDLEVDEDAIAEIYEWFALERGLI